MSVAIVRAAFVAAAALLLPACTPDEPRAQPTAAPATASFTFDIVREYPHDPQAFTQGLLFRDGFLYESTGLNGRSSLRKEIGRAHV